MLTFLAEHAEPVTWSWLGVAALGGLGTVAFAWARSMQLQAKEQWNHINDLRVNVSSLTRMAEDHKSWNDQLMTKLGVIEETVRELHDDSIRRKG